LQHAAFLLPTLAPHPTELSKVFQAGCFNFAQMKASVELCINKLSDAAAKAGLKANCEKFGSEISNHCLCCEEPSSLFLPLSLISTKPGEYRKTLLLSLMFGNDQ